VGRPRVHDETTRERLLEVAGNILRRDGPAALTVRRLANEADTSTSAIYTLFGSKDGVVRTMYRAGFDNLAAHQDDVGTAARMSPVERVRRLAAAYRAAARARPHLYDVMFACPFPEFAPDDEDQARALATLGRLHEAVDDAIAAGELVGDADVVTMGLWATVHGLAMLELAGSLDVETDADAVWEATVEAVLDGLRSS
jgi:AcrR family transcriptional regulator